MPYGTLNADKVVNSDSITSGGLYGFKNRIINGAMMIDQRNAGAAVSLNNTSGFSCDRWQARIVGGGVVSMQRSTVVPAGFTNSQSLTVTTADASIASTDDYKVGQFIEGFNVADLGWGAAGAQSVTLSFWVRSSITGTYAVALQNSAENRSYPATYTISATNTWEQKTITIAGDTSGTWLTDSGIGIRLNWNLGSGSSFNGTANAWNAADARTVSGAVSWIATNGATFYITGVQLERGSTATSFDYRPYGTELMLCQRYYEALSANAGSAPAAGGFFALGVCETTTRVQPYYTFKVVKRAGASTTLSTISSFGIRSTSSSFACTSGTFGAPTNAYAQGEFNNGGGGLVAGGCGWLTNHTGAATIEWSAEL